MNTKKLIIFVLVAMLLSGCASETVATALATTQLPPTEPVTTMPVVEIPEPTLPEHSDLYTEDVTIEDAILWFSEVCLDSEIINSGDPSKVQRWEDPILYQLHGQPTSQDLEVLGSFSNWLNQVEGFPGIAEAGDGDFANMNIYFTDHQGLLDIMGDNFADVDGAMTFWYDVDVIYAGDICIRTDLPQDLRNSVILEELYNCLGPVQDTVLREDSIIYQYFSQPQALTAVDELILKLLYHPQIQCGMDQTACEEVLRNIYY